MDCHCAVVGAAAATAAGSTARPGASAAPITAPFAASGAVAWSDRKGILKPQPGGDSPVLLAERSGCCTKGGSLGKLKRAPEGGDSVGVDISPATDDKGSTLGGGVAGGAGGPNPVSFGSGRPNRLGELVADRGVAAAAAC